LRVIVADPISEKGIEILRSSGIPFDYSPEISGQDLSNVIQDYDALIVRSRTKVTKEMIQRGTTLKVIGRAGVGIDNIDAREAAARHIVVLNTPNALTNAVAEFTIGLMLSMARKIPPAAQSMKSGQWEKSKFRGSELRGKIYGTIGIGRIGQRVAEIAHFMGMKILANDVIPVPVELVRNLEIKVATQAEIFADSDFIDLHVPLTPETENLVNYLKIKLMKRTAFLINTSRGKVVNETDLLRALDEKLIAGAALDVFDTEPPTLRQLILQENLIATPHIAGQTEEAQAAAGTEIVELVLKTRGSP
jgi:D-3-phosphoglycerate dehydrogenase